MTRRMQQAVSGQLRTQLIYYADIFYRSPAVRFSLAACILGLSLARVTHSASLYFISVKFPVLPARSEVFTIDKTRSAVTDPQTAIGGALFQRAAENTAIANRVAEQPIKPFKLTATLESSSDNARALIETQGQGSREYCTVGESCKRGDCACVIQNVKIVKIAKEQIWLKSGGAQFSLRIGQSSTEAFAAQPDSEKKPTQAEAGRRMAGSSQMISRESIRKILEGKEGRILEGQFGPHVVDGKITGYKIVRIGEDHIFAKLGARNGDIVRRVNGYPLDGMERLMDLWKAVQTAPEIKIDL